MPRGQLTSVLRHIRRLAGRPADGRWTDRQLLRRFAAENDEAAFALLVERHGPMVLSVCRRILRHQQDAEDAFQATFLVLARKAGAVAWRESAGGWLYEVAQRVAHGARRAAARRHGHERRAAETHPTEQPSEQGRDELRALLDEELRRLPEKYRAPLVLCYLESYSHTEAARHLGWAVGTVKGRLARARDLLQRRLAGRDIALPAAALGAVLAEQAVGWAVPVTLVHATVKLALVVATGAAAGEAASATVAALADGLLRSLAVARLKAVGALLLAFSVVAAGAGLAAHRQWAEDRPDTEPQAVPRQHDAGRPAGADARGDPLPPGAVVRLGTPRFRHGGTILDVAFSPDGTLLATAGDDNSTRLWDPATGRELRRLAGHTGPVRYIAFAPQGRLLASAGDDQTVRVWDTATGREVGPPVRFRTGLSDCYGFDRGATTLAFLSPDQTVHFWDVMAGTDISEDPRLAPRGRSWKLPDGAKAGRAALSPDGKLFALALAHRNRDTAVHLWDVAAGEELRRFGGGGVHAGAVAFTPDGKTLAVAAGELTLWDVATGALVQKLPGPRPPCCVCFSPDGRFLASSGEGDRTVLWDLTAADGPRAAWIAGLGGGGAGGGRVAFSSDSRRLAWCTDRAVHLLDTAARKELPGHTGHAGAVELVAFAPDGRTVVSVGDTVRAWDAATGKELGGLPGPIEARAAVALARDGRTVAVGMPGTAVVRDVATGKVLRSFPAPGGHGLALALSPDGRTLAMHGTDQLGPARETSIRLCDVATGEEPRRIGENEADVTSLAFAPDGTKLAARGSKHIRVWDVATGTRIADISVFLGAGAIGEAAALSLSPDGRLLAAADSAHAVRVWDVGCGQEVRRFSGHRSRVRATAFAPDGSTLVSAAADGTLRLWDVASGKLLHEVPGHQEEVLAVAVSPDGRRVASAGADTTVLIWDVAGLKDIGRPPAAPVAPGEFPGLWADLAATNTPRPRADRAMRRLAEAPASAVSFLEQRLRQESEVEDRVKWLIAGLDSDLRAVRARSTRELRRLGKTAAPALRNALAGNPSPEARLRIEVLLRFLADNEPRPRQLAPEELRLVRAAVVLARIGTPEATAALRALAANHALRSAIEEADFSEQPLVNEAKAALEDLKGQPAPGQ